MERANSPNLAETHDSTAIPKTRQIGTQYEQKVISALPDFRKFLSTGFICGRGHESLSFTFSTPTAAKVDYIKKILEDLCFVPVKDELIILSSDLNKITFSENIFSLHIPIEIVEGLTTASQSYFLNLIDACLEPVPDNKSAIAESDIFFLKRLIHGLKNEKKYLESNDFSVPLYKKPLNKPASHTSSTTKKAIVKLFLTEKITFSEIALRLNCSRFIVSRVISQYKLQSHPRTCACFDSIPRQIITPEIHTSISQLIQAKRGLITAKTIQNHVFTIHKTRISKSTIYSFLHNKLGLSYRRGGSYIPWLNSRRYKLFRFRYVEQLLNLVKRDYVPISLDEAGFRLSELEAYVWTSRGNPAPRSHSIHDQRLNMILAIGLDGLVASEFHIGNTNQLIFINFLDSLLQHLNELKNRTGKKYFVIADNCPFHKTPYVRALISKYGCPFLFSAPHSSFSNPVEFVNHFLKLSLTLSHDAVWYIFYKFLDYRYA